MKPMHILLLAFTSLCVLESNASGGAPARTPKYTSTQVQEQLAVLRKRLEVVQETKKSYQRLLNEQQKKLEDVMRPYFLSLDDIDKQINALQNKLDEKAATDKLKAEKGALKKKYTAQSEPIKNSLQQYRAAFKKAENEHIQLEKQIAALDSNFIPKMIVEKTSLEKRVILPQKIITALAQKDNATVIAWIDEASENKNAYNPLDDNQTLLMYSIAKYKNSEIFNALLKRKVDTLAETSTKVLAFRFVIRNLILDYSAFDLCSFFALMIKQGFFLKSLNDVFEKMTKAVEEIDQANLSSNLTLGFRRLNQCVNDLTKGSVIEKEITLQTPLPQEIANYIKELFNLPFGDQEIVHEMKKAIRENDLKKLKELLGKNKEYIELQDENGYTPLLQAVYTDKPESVAFLIQEGANRNASIKGADGKPVNALELAQLLNYEDIIALLMSASENIALQGAAHKK